MKITFEKATSDLLDEIFENYKIAIADMIGNGIFQWDDKYPTKEILASDIENNDLYAIMADDKIVGGFVMNTYCDDEYFKANWEYPDDTYYVLHRLCIHPDYQKMGIAARVMDFIESSALKDGKNAVHLDTFAGNPKALSLYRTRGYKEVGLAHWRKGEFIIFEKHLSL